MTSIDISSVELLKKILSNLNTPQALNDHPWAANTGDRLVEKTLDAFRRMLPPSPPRTGKRLDTRWGAFGILAAQYFAPHVSGTPSPSSLRDAWDSVDQSILLFVYGRSDGLSEEEKNRYCFAGNESQPAPNSTLSDWHRKGLEQLAKMMAVEQTQNMKNTNMKNALFKKVSLALAVLLLLGIGFLSWKAWVIYQRVQAIQQKVDILNDRLSSQPDLEQLPEISILVHDLRGEIDALQSETAPYLWLTEYSGWIPTYGGTLEQAEDMLIFTQSLTAAADDGLSAVSPAIETALRNDQPVEVLDLLIQLQRSSPKLLSAQIAFAQAQETRKHIDTNRLTPHLQNMIVKKIDPLLGTISGTFPMEDALTLVSVAPDLLGSGKAGPQTYLILMQNEDELRPTGGFLTAIGSMVVKDGKILNIKIEASDKLDDFSKPYPIPPWQFEEFMGIEMFLLRDSNWFTDFPTTVSWSEYFYSYTRGSSADGVITLNMNVITEMLKILGPVHVDSVRFPITSKNVQEYLRSAEQAKPRGVKKQDWDRKQFIAELAQPILQKIVSARGETWSKLAPILLSLLDEKHILLQFDNKEMASLLERRNWDGAVRIPEQADFLMVVDTNMGYNKSNAVMKTTLEYSIDLTRIKQPSSTLSIYQKNLSKKEITCEPFATGKAYAQNLAPGKIREPIYNMDECHWGYIRVYLTKGTRLVGSNPQEIPDIAAWHKKAIPPRTDDLDNEDIPNAQVFGMMTLTPTDTTTVSEFKYVLPASVIIFDEVNNLYTYKLRVQKQPGILSQNFTFTIRLPEGSKPESANVPLVENAGAWTAQLDLRQDIWVEIRFR